MLAVFFLFTCKKYNHSHCKGFDLCLSFHNRENFLYFIVEKVMAKMLRYPFQGKKLVFYVTKKIGSTVTKFFRNQ